MIGARLVETGPVNMFAVEQRSHYRQRIQQPAEDIPFGDGRLNRLCAAPCVREEQPGSWRPPFSRDRRGGRRRGGLQSGPSIGNRAMPLAKSVKSSPVVRSYSAHRESAYLKRRIKRRPRGFAPSMQSRLTLPPHEFHEAVPGATLCAS
jgi:hypothetical protein